MKRSMLMCVAVVMFAVTGFGLTDQIYAETNASSASEKEVFKDFICHKNYFTAKIPKSWVKYEDIVLGEAAKEYGVNLRGPKNKDGGYSSISITYYGSDHRRFKSAEDYLKVNVDPGMSLPGEVYGPVKTVSIAGRAASQFDIKTFSFIPPYAVKPVKIPMFERYIILKGKEGFYVLEYSAPEDISDKSMKIFDQVVASFKPNA